MESRHGRSTMETSPSNFWMSVQYAMCSRGGHWLAHPPSLASAKRQPTLAPQLRMAQQHGGVKLSAEDLPGEAVWMAAPWPGGQALILLTLDSFLQRRQHLLCQLLHPLLHALLHLRKQSLCKLQELQLRMPSPGYSGAAPSKPPASCVMQGPGAPPLNSTPGYSAAAPANPLASFAMQAPGVPSAYNVVAPAPPQSSGARLHLMPGYARR